MCKQKRITSVIFPQPYKPDNFEQTVDQALNNKDNAVLDEAICLLKEFLEKMRFVYQVCDFLRV